MRRSIGRAMLVLGVAIGLVAWLVSGYSVAVLASRSMEPWAGPGALLVHRQVPVDDVGPGDVITVRAVDRGLVTHRVVEVTAPEVGPVSATLQGDRSRFPDPEPVDLVGEVDRVVVVVPRLGDVLRVGGPALLSGAALLALGTTALLLGRPGKPAAATDPRIDALVATCEQFADDGMPPAMLRDLVRVRVAGVLALPPAEQSQVVAELDDGGRFYVVALTDADPDALQVIPVDSARRRGATAAIDAWWDVVGHRVPSPVHTAIASWT